MANIWGRKLEWEEIALPYLFTLGQIFYHGFKLDRLTEIMLVIKV